MVISGIPLWLPLAVIGAIAAWQDVKYRRLPNWLCAITLVAGLAATFMAGGWTAAGSAMLHALIAFAGWAVLFALGWVGGGDTKYYASVASWFGLAKALYLLVCVALSGLVLAIIWFVIRNRIADLAGDDKARRAELKQMPYGVAISIGAVATALSF